ncbi:MAG: hypothetical protein JJU27_06445 [Gammaproteobacteria bacterium]|nr:hypothetical protein [Gammaproteobacteria bacterium]
MVLFQGLFFSVIGLGLLAVSYQSLGRGWLPCGPNGFRGRVEVQRRTQPVAYWTLLAGYTLFALWVLRYGVGILFGTMDPLPLS